MKASVYIIEPSAHGTHLRNFSVNVFPHMPVEVQPTLKRGLDMTLITDQRLKLIYLSRKCAPLRL